MFKNDGNIFRDQDWSRLKKIGAQNAFFSPSSCSWLTYSWGQSWRGEDRRFRSRWVSIHKWLWIPAHSKVVILGFYSLFSVTEEPFVTSGGNDFPIRWPYLDLFLPDQWMGFYWKDKKDQVSHKSISSQFLLNCIYSSLSVAVLSLTSRLPIHGPLSQWISVNPPQCPTHSTSPVSSRPLSLSCPIYRKSASSSTTSGLLS